MCFDVFARDAMLWSCAVKGQGMPRWGNLPGALLETQSIALGILERTSEAGLER
jgi:hypothetical protein